MVTRKNRLTEAVITCTHDQCLEQKYENSQRFSKKIVIFTAVKNRCMLHGRVFVMRQRLTAHDQTQIKYTKNKCMSN